MEIILEQLLLILIKLYLGKNVRKKCNVLKLTFGVLERHLLRCGEGENVVKGI